MAMAEKLNPGEILIAEYNYVAQTVFQANEDRARVASFYVVSFGSFLAALVGAQFDKMNTQVVNLGFAGLFLALTVMGYLTLLQLARLRSAWFESIRAMNKVKDFYMSRFPDLEEAFDWRTDTLPVKFKTKSVGFYMIVQVALLGGVALGAAIYFGIMALFGSPWLLPGIVAGFIFFFLQIDLYRQMLK
jgi:hypothetical protein